jgi:hypothetical protein
VFTSAPHDSAGSDGPDQTTSRTRRDNRLRYFVINSHPNQALDLLQQSLDRSPVRTANGSLKFLKLPAATVVNKVLDSSAQRPELAGRAAALAAAATAQGVTLEPRTLQSLLLGLAQRGDVDAALPLLDAWLASQDEALADDDLASKGPLRTLSSLLDSAARADDPATALQILARMARAGLAPRPRSVAALLRAFMRLGDAKTATAMLEWMRRSGDPPTIMAYTALLTPPVSSVSTAEPLALLELAKGSWLLMEREGVAPDARFFTAYIRFVGRLGCMEEVMRGWTALREAGLLRDQVAYGTMLDACAKVRSGLL